MPRLLEHIDAIARQKQRCVLYVEFHPLARDPKTGEALSEQDVWAWKALPIRQKIIDWLDAQGIGWQRCGHFAVPGMSMGYRGQLYIDLPYVKSSPVFQKLEGFLENPDGTMRYPEVFLIYCSLGEAMENVAHDELGFWDRYSENL